MPTNLENSAVATGLEKVSFHSNLKEMEYYSGIKGNASESDLMRWMKLYPIMQSEESQKKNHKYCILTHICEI